LLLESSTLGSLRFRRCAQHVAESSATARAMLASVAVR
jgi:hypothetical protein